MKREASRGRHLFPRSLLLFLLSVSLAANVILVSRLHYPHLWDDLLTALSPAPEISEDDHLLGNPDDEVTLIEYSDFQCPFSSEFHRTAGLLFEETGFIWIYRHFPLGGNRSISFMAAEAAECAGEQGLFWEYVDALFDYQQDLSEEMLHDIAELLYLDHSEFQECLETEKYGKAVESQRRQALEIHISKTPTFYVNGRRFEGALSYPELKEILLREHGEKSGIKKTDQ